MLLFWLLFFDNLGCQQEFLGSMIVHSSDVRKGGMGVPVEANAVDGILFVSCCLIRINLQ
jgi:hypothetical protein